VGQLVIFLLIGLFFAWIFRSYRRYESSGPYKTEQFRDIPLTYDQIAKSELGLFVALAAKVAKADGRVDTLEAELVGNMFSDISALFPDPQATRALLKEVFSREKEQRDNLIPVASALNRRIGRDRHKRHMMMAFLVSLAYVDGHLSREEEQMLREIAALLQFLPAEIETLLRHVAGTNRNATSHQSLEAAYALLGASSQDDAATLKKRYRALVREHHPDIVKAQGKSDDYVEEATRKVQEINAAYETLKKARGL